MMRRIGHALGSLLAWAFRVVEQVGGAANGGRSSGRYAARQYASRRDDYRP